MLTQAQLREIRECIAERRQLLFATRKGLPAIVAVHPDRNERILFTAPKRQFDRLASHIEALYEEMTDAHR